MLTKSRLAATHFANQDDHVARSYQFRDRLCNATGVIGAVCSKSNHEKLNDLA